MSHVEKHAVLVRIRLSDDELGTPADDSLVESVDTAIQAALQRPPRVGYWDGHEFGDGWAAIFCYGRDATALRERVLDAILPLNSVRKLYVAADIDRPTLLDGIIVVGSEGARQRSH